MSIALLTPLWCRPEIECVVLEYYAEYIQVHYSGCDDGPIELFAAYSDETQPEMLACAHDHGWTLIRCPSTPLGAKLNAATRQLRELTDATGVVFFGSDDFIHTSAMADLTNAGEEYGAAGFTSCYILDAQTWRAGQLQRGKAPTRPSGAGRYLSREVLDALDWTLRDDWATRGLDGCLDQRMREQGIGWHILPPASPEAPVIDVKTATNVTTFETLIRHGSELKPIPPALILAPFGTELTTQLAQIGQGYMPERILPPDPVSVAMRPAVKLEEAQMRADEQRAMDPVSRRVSIRSVHPQGHTVSLEATPALRAKGFAPLGVCPKAIGLAHLLPAEAQWGAQCVEALDGEAISDGHPCACVEALVMTRRKGWQ